VLFFQRLITPLPQRSGPEWTEVNNRSVYSATLPTQAEWKAVAYTRVITTLRSLRHIAYYGSDGFNSVSVTPKCVTLHTSIPLHSFPPGSVRLGPYRNRSARGGGAIYVAGSQCAVARFLSRLPRL